MTLVTICTPHRVARLGPNEPWSETKYAAAVKLRNRIYLREGVCNLCMKDAMGVFRKQWEERYARHDGRLLQEVS
jgi:hypothetical protein